MNFRKSAGEAATLVVAAGLCAAVSNSLAGPERKLRWVGEYRDVEARPASAVAAADKSAGKPALPLPAGGSELGFLPHPDKPWVEIIGEDAVALFYRKSIFLDARRTSVYRDGHIAGARPFAVWEADVDGKVKKLYEEGLDQNAPLVVYCSGGECEDSHMLAQKLYMVGFNNVLVYKDGFPDWEKRALPVAKGDAP